MPACHWPHTVDHTTQEVVSLISIPLHLWRRRRGGKFVCCAQVSVCLVRKTQSWPRRRRPVSRDQKTHKNKKKQFTSSVAGVYLVRPSPTSTPISTLFSLAQARPKVGWSTPIERSSHRRRPTKLGQLGAWSKPHWALLRSFLCNKLPFYLIFS